MYDQGCTISNLANTRVDSLHTSDLSPQTQFHILFAIKVPFFFFFLLFRITMTQHVFDKAEKKGNSREPYHSYEYESKHSVVRNRAFFLPMRQTLYSDINAAPLALATRG